MRKAEIAAAGELAGEALAGLHHFDLLSHPAVYAQLRAWLAQPAAGATTPATPASPRAFG